MPAQIKDEFTGKGHSRARLYQLRHKRDGLCEECSKPSFKAGKCVGHYKRAKANWQKKYVRKTTDEQHPRVHGIV